MEFKITLTDKEIQTMKRLGTLGIVMDLLTAGAEDAARDDDQIIESTIENVVKVAEKPEKKAKKETKVVEKVEEIEQKQEEKASGVFDGLAKVIKNVAEVLEKEENAPELNQVEVRKELTDLMRSGKPVKAEIAKLGYEKLTEVPKELWQALLDAARAL